ncbi:PREDICTED: uncharacterized protein LOC108361175 [Rhagoletis zephyria]|uniref:uncharacterized protein LOC108361175 n=1 Tax=Rhagoletis zephyria TaxID=28612 RepID=UPI0008115FAB|nr:PREDICTED: uncharacterized protein LOC108361175 [Rhagoletis zephyria]
MRNSSNQNEEKEAEDSRNDMKSLPAFTPLTSRLQNVKETNDEEPEQQLTTVISGIQHILQQSKDCLKSLQKQNEELKQKFQSKESLNSQVSMLQKVHILLDGLTDTHRTLAERRIIQFLCECQIKILNEENVGDVCYTQEF